MRSEEFFAILLLMLPGLIILAPVLAIIAFVRVRRLEQQGGAAVEKT